MRVIERNGRAKSVMAPERRGRTHVTGGDRIVFPIKELKPTREDGGDHEDTG
jgi:hypothetical protein